MITKNLNSNDFELIDFRIFETQNNEYYEGIYGINVAKVQEIIKMPPIFEMPSEPDYVAGVFDLRGIFIPLIDLSKWIGIKPAKSQKHKSVIIAEFSNIKIGFIVDFVKRIRRVSSKEIQPAHFGTPQNREKITGSIRIEEGKTLLILDLESIMDDLNLHQNNNLLKVDPKDKFSGMVLFLEDSHSARKLIRKDLLEMGFEIIEATDGEEGIAKLEKLYNEFKQDLPQNLRLIISDVEMPKMDGFDFLSKIHSDERFWNIPVIFNSSICDRYSEEKALELGAQAYLVKFDHHKFYDEILKILS